jgi:hypothetical protein
MVMETQYMPGISLSTDPEIIAAEMRRIWSPIYLTANKNSMYLDIEAAHKRADKLMCTLLDKLGYDEAADIFRNADKWYS